MKPHYNVRSMVLNTMDVLTMSTAVVAADLMSNYLSVFPFLRYIAAGWTLLLQSFERNWIRKFFTLFQRLRSDPSAGGSFHL